jgi:hypothetical protein
MMKEAHHELLVAVCNRSALGHKPSLRPVSGPNSEADFGMYSQSSFTQGSDVQSLQADHSLRTSIPFREAPPRRKVVWIWTCVSERGDLIHNPPPDTLTFVLMNLTPNTLSVHVRPGWNEGQRGSMLSLRALQMSKLRDSPLQQSSVLKCV